MVDGADTPGGEEVSSSVPLGVDGPPWHISSAALEADLLDIVNASWKSRETSTEVIYGLKSARILFLMYGDGCLVFFNEARTVTLVKTRGEKSGQVHIKLVLSKATLCSGSYNIILSERTGTRLQAKRFASVLLLLAAILHKGVCSTIVDPDIRSVSFSQTNILSISGVWY